MVFNLYLFEFLFYLSTKTHFLGGPLYLCLLTQITNCYHDNIITINVSFFSEISFYFFFFYAVTWIRIKYYVLRFKKLIKINTVLSHPFTTLSSICKKMGWKLQLHDQPSLSRLGKVKSEVSLPQVFPYSTFYNN